MSTRRALIDVSDLPDHGFGTKVPAAWGTMGFMAIEGTSLALCLAALLYLRKNFESYPPAGTASPDLLIPAIGTLLLLLTVIPTVFAYKAAHRHDIGGVRRWLVVVLLLEVAILIVRALCFDALNTRWDSNAYGSVLWFTLGLHTFLLLADFGETAAIAAIFFRGPVEKKHFSDAEDDILYGWFLVAAWIPCYLLLFLGPYFL